MQPSEPEVELALVRRDTDRLLWLINFEARVAVWVGGGWRVCRNCSGRLKWYGRPAPNPRAAIDSAMEDDRHGR
jgi:hypothetical protein